MQTPFSPPSDRIQPVRIAMAMLLTGSVFCFSGAIAARLYSFIQIYQDQRLDQIQQSVVDRVEMLKAKQSYNICIITAEQVPMESSLYTRAQSLKDECQGAITETKLRQAQQYADAGQLKAAIAELKTISDDAATVRVQQLLGEWSNRILQIAEGYYFSPSNRLDDAIRTANTIAVTDPLYLEAQAKIRDWQADWQTNQAHWQRAQTLLAAQEYGGALQESQQVTHPYWIQQTATIVRQAQVGQAIDQKNWQPATLEADSSPTQPTLSLKVLLLLGWVGWVAFGKVKARSS